MYFNYILKFFRRKYYEKKTDSKEKISLSCSEIIDDFDIYNEYKNDR